MSQRGLITIGIGAVLVTLGTSACTRPPMLRVSGASTTRLDPRTEAYAAYRKKIDLTKSTGKVPSFTPQEQVTWEAEGRDGVVATVKQGDTKRVVLLFSPAFSSLTRIDPNLKDENGDPLLVIAVRGGDPDIVKTLVKAGADPEQAGASGETATALARSSHRADLLQAMSKPSGR